MQTLWERDAGQGVRVVRLIESQDARRVGELVRLFENIAAIEGWEPGDALRRWQSRSVYFALEIGGQIAGGLQLVPPDADGPSPTLPCQSVWPDVSVSDDSSPCRAAHIAILALEQSYRGEGLLFWRLVIEMWRYCVGQGITTLFIEVTPRVLPLYQRLGWPLSIQGSLRRHWGEDCYLCTLGIPDVAQALLRRAENSPYYRQIIAQAFRVTFEEPESKRSPIVRERRAAYGSESYAFAA